MPAAKRAWRARRLPAMQPLTLLAQTGVLGGQVVDVRLELRHALAQVEVLPPQVVAHQGWRPRTVASSEKTEGARITASTQAAEATKSRGMKVSKAPHREGSTA